MLIELVLVAPPAGINMPAELPADVPPVGGGWALLVAPVLIDIDVPGRSTISSPAVAVAACAGVNIICTDSMSSSTLYVAVDCVCITPLALVWVPANALPPRLMPVATANISAAASVPRIPASVPMSL